MYWLGLFFFCLFMVLYDMIAQFTTGLVAVKLPNCQGVLSFCHDKLASNAPEGAGVSHHTK